MNLKIRMFTTQRTRISFPDRLYSSIEPSLDIYLYFNSFERNMLPGRPRCPRRIEKEPDVIYFKPRGVPLRDLEVVVLQVEGLEAIRLVDLEGMEQEQAAMIMGVSRRAFWGDLQNARKGVADALVGGKAIKIEGGSYEVGRTMKSGRTNRHCQRELSGTGQHRSCPRAEGWSSERTRTKNEERK